MDPTAPVSRWLTSVRPELAAFANVFEDQGYDTGEDLLGMHPSNVADILEKLGSAGAKPGFVNKVERALDALHRQAAAAAAAAAVEQGVVERRIGILGGGSC